jgi:SAM-dependent MidA family methyltransferase
MAFLPFDQYQGEVNKRYYSKKGQRIYDDFSTFAFGNGRLAQADAREFYRLAGKVNGELRICEFGVGNGFFAKAFLDELKRLDVKNNTKRSEWVSYSLVDFSERMLNDAKRNLVGYRIGAFLSDSLSFQPKKKFHYIRASELLSDLPSKLLFMKECGVHELGFEGKEPASKEYRGKADGIEEFPEGYVYPLNLGAIEFLKNVPKLLEKGGYADIFDYGFAEASEALEWERPAWNESVSRWYGEQVTVDVNFFHLKNAFKKLTVEGQKDYAQRALGEKVFQAHVGGKLCYLNALELKSMSGELKKEGYGKEFIAGEYEEESDFWHARVEC